MTNYEMICQESGNLSVEEQARVLQYGKSVQNVTGNRVSRQTVMNKVRESHIPTTPKQELRKVKALHIDADESHVTLCGGKSAIVPLVSAYEGIAKHGARGMRPCLSHRVVWKETGGYLGRSPHRT